MTEIYAEEEPLRKQFGYDRKDGEEDIRMLAEGRVPGKGKRDRQQRD